MDIRQSTFYSDYIKSIGWVVEKSGETNVFIRKIGPISVIKIQRPEKLDISDVNRIVRKYRPLLVKIEPDIALRDPRQTRMTSFWGAERLQNLQAGGFTLDRWPLLPTKSLVLNLNANLNSLPKDTRYEIRKAEEKCLSFKTSNDIELFYKLLQETMKIGGWSIPIKKEVTNLYRAFQPKNSQLFLVHPPEALDQRLQEVLLQKALGGALVIWSGNTAHYMYAALTKEGRELGAAYFLLWNVIEFCQSKKLKYLDLEGIHDERYPKQTKHWQGFTKFKQGWGGKVVEYPGSFTKYANPFVKLLFSLT